MKKIYTDILVVGGGTGGTAAAIQAARRGIETILVSEHQWLGGMLTSAGVCAPDGNELSAWQTGIWGAYLRELRQKQPGGLDNGWVSLFTYHPHIGVQIFADWVEKIPNLQWIAGYQPLEVIKQGDRITAVRFADFEIAAKIIIDGTELGDLLALGEIAHRWGWELQAEFNEPSAPLEHNQITKKYPVQAPTWVFMLQYVGKTDINPEEREYQSIPAWENYGAVSFLNYGKLQPNLYMINWPIAGNDYGAGLHRLVESEASKQKFLQEVYQHSEDFAAYIKSYLGESYNFASGLFPHEDKSLNTAFALHPYYRESRRLRGKVTVTERDILPIAGGCVAALPTNDKGEVNAIAIGNYENDHHYPDCQWQLQPKSIRWGGRKTGTPFTIPYDALIPESTAGLLVCEKNISVSHITNGCTRLQPLVMNIGQAAGMASALCIELNCQPTNLPVSRLQQALLTDAIAPSAIFPLYNLPPYHPQWLQWQQYYLQHPEDYPLDGNCPATAIANSIFSTVQQYRGEIRVTGEQQYDFVTEVQGKTQKWQLITTEPHVNRQLLNYRGGETIAVAGNYNNAGNWLKISQIIK